MIKLRDQFAMLAAPVYLANGTAKEAAQYSYEFADEMCKARDRRRSLVRENATKQCPFKVGDTVKFSQQAKDDYARCRKRPDLTGTVVRVPIGRTGEVVVHWQGAAPKGIYVRVGMIEKVVPNGDGR